MRCWKCGKPVENDSSVCLYCNTAQERNATITDIGKAMREIYDHFGCADVFGNSSVLVNSIGDLIPDSKLLKNQFNIFFSTGASKLYLNQINNAGYCDEQFRQRINTILSEEAGLSDKKIEELTGYFDEMIGWTVLKPSQPVQQTAAVIVPAASPSPNPNPSHAEPPMIQAPAVSIPESSRSAEFFDSLKNDLEWYCSNCSTVNKGGIACSYCGSKRRNVEAPMPPKDDNRTAIDPRENIDISNLNNLAAIHRTLHRYNNTLQNSSVSNTYAQPVNTNLSPGVYSPRTILPREYVERIEQPINGSSAMHAYPVSVAYENAKKNGATVKIGKTKMKAFIPPWVDNGQVLRVYNDNGESLFVKVNLIEPGLTVLCTVVILAVFFVVEKSGGILGAFGAAFIAFVLSALIESIPINSYKKKLKEHS